MKDFILFDEKTLAKYLGKRAGETKLGESLSFVSSVEELKNHSEKYVIFGIPEDIGIRANFGKPGAVTSWESFLSSFVNIQINQYNHAGNCLILGYVSCEDLMQEAEELVSKSANYHEEFGKLVSSLDDRVSEVVRQIVAAGKVPVIIGGGHNNAYGNIKGTAQALKHAVNILNIDAHTDLRHTDYRHSGNGFSFAIKDGFLVRYAMFGIHKNYTPQYIFDIYEKDENIDIQLYEDLIGGDLAYQLRELDKVTGFLENSFGLEIDCDVIEDFSSSAMTPSGFSVKEMRNFINLAKRNRIHYLHLTEAAAKGNPQIGKALSYFVSDFIREE